MSVIGGGSGGLVSRPHEYDCGPSLSVFHQTRSSLAVGLLGVAQLGNRFTATVVRRLCPAIAATVFDSMRRGPVGSHRPVDLGGP
jgi:hypothetical protein